MRLTRVFLPLLLLLTGCTQIIHATRDTPIQPDPEETTIGTDINDWQMETAIGVNIKKAHSLLEHAHVSVNAYNGVILLTGEVPDANVRTIAGETARKYPRVRLVHNELQVQGNTSFLSRTNDSWLATKLKTKFIANRDVSASKVKIVTEAGVVYLMGTVNRHMADQAAAIASNTSGVRRVVKVFELLD